MDIILKNVEYKGPNNMNPTKIMEVISFMCEQEEIYFDDIKAVEEP